MKRVLKLTESQLTRVLGKIIEEQVSSAHSNTPTYDLSRADIIKVLTKDGWKTSVGDLPLNMSIPQVQGMIKKNNLAVVQGNAVGTNEYAAGRQATQEVQMRGGRVPLLKLLRTLSDGKIEMMVFMGKAQEQTVAPQGPNKYSPEN